LKAAEEFLADAEERDHDWQRFAPHAFSIVVMCLLAYFVYRVVTGDPTTRKNVSQVVTVKLVQPPPPPPPPPKPEEQTRDKPEPKPEPLEKPIPAAQPPPLAAPSEGPPGPPGPPGVAGLPGGGAPGGVAGGGGGTGAGTGTGGNPFGAYTALLQSRVQSAVQRQPALRRSRYHVEVRVWLAADGAPKRVELGSTLGNPELDRQFRETLLSMGRLPQAPPAQMPQPVVLRVNSL
jgi:protein TonB